MYRHDPALIALIHADRAREIERRARIHREQPRRIGRQPIRRVVGRQLVRFGARLAGDAPFEPARSHAGSARVDTPGARVARA